MRKRTSELEREQNINWNSITNIHKYVWTLNNFFFVKKYMYICMKITNV